MCPQPLGLSMQKTYWHVYSQLASPHGGLTHIFISLCSGGLLCNQSFPLSNGGGLSRLMPAAIWRLSAQFVAKCVAAVRDCSTRRQSHGGVIGRSAYIWPARTVRRRGDRPRGAKSYICGLAARRLIARICGISLEIGGPAKLRRRGGETAALTAQAYLKEK